MDPNYIDPANPKPQFVLTGLTDGQVYYIGITAYNVSDIESSFVEIDTAPPQITSSPTVVNITETTATISWTTDKVGTSIVEYGLDSNYGSSAPVPPSSDYVTSHLVNIDGLSAGTTYHFQASSVNRQGIGPATLPGDNNPSLDDTFTTSGAGQTDTTPPVLTNIPIAIDTSDTSATIVWTTDEPCNSVVEYGLDMGYGNTVVNETDVVSHSVLIESLNADTTYQFRVHSTDIA